MRKLILCMAVLSFTGLSIKIATAKEPAENINTLTSSSASTDVSGYISNIYGQIDFKGKNKLSFEVFDKAYRGYLNLQNEGKLGAGKDLLTVCDLSQSSTKLRLWVIDMKAKKVILNDYVAHGQGSGDEFAVAFSNKENSHQSSLGFYVTGDTYVGQHGTSLRLYGMDNGFNSAAYDRAIVVHGADYVCPEFVAGQKKLGRSWGCPAVSNKVAGKMIQTIKDGTCLFIYYPQKNYMAKSYWLNKKIERLPGELLPGTPQSTPLNEASKPSAIYVYSQGTQSSDPKNKSFLEMDYSFIDQVLP